MKDGEEDKRIGNMYWKLRKRHGRKPKYEDPDKLWKDCLEYFEFMEDNKYEFEDNKGTKNVNTIKLNRPYTLHTLCLYLDISRDTWIDWRINKDLFEVVHKVDDIIYNQKFEGAVLGIYQQNIIIRDLALADKKDHSSTDGTMTPSPTIIVKEELKDQIDKLG